MKAFELKKGERKEVTLLEIRTKKEVEGKIYNCFFDGTLEQAKEKLTWLNERILVSAEKREIEVHYNKFEKDFINELGLLCTDDFTENPNYVELMKITPKDVAEAEDNEAMQDFYKNIENTEE